MRTSLWLLYIVGLFWRIMTDRIAKMIWQMWIVFFCCAKLAYHVINKNYSQLLFVNSAHSLPTSSLDESWYTNELYQSVSNSKRTRVFPVICHSDGSRAEHLTVESYTVVICQQSYLYWYSITHSPFHSRLKTFLFCKSFPLQPFLFFFSTTWSTTCSRLHVVLHVASVKGSTEQHCDYMHL